MKKTQKTIHLSTKLLAVTLLAALSSITVNADTALVEYHQLMKGKAPKSTIGAGSCQNLITAPNVISRVKMCALHTKLTNNNYFWVYTGGPNAGRCCPKKANMVSNSSITTPINNGAFFNITP